MRLDTAQDLTKEQMNDEERNQLEMSEQLKKVGFFGLFRFSTLSDKIMMILGTFFSAVIGILVVSFAFFWGRMNDALLEDQQSLLSASFQLMLVMIYFGVGSFISGVSKFALWSMTGQRQANKCRLAFLKSLLDQQIGWHDLRDKHQILSAFALDSHSYQLAIKDKISTLIFSLSMVGASFVFSFISGWLLAFVTISITPIFILSGFLFTKYVAKSDENNLKNYMKASASAQEAFSLIQTVKQMNAENYEKEKFSKILEENYSKIFGNSFKMGIGVGGIYMASFLSFGISLLFGIQCVLGSELCPPNSQGQTYSPGNIITIILSICYSAFNANQILPSVQAIINAKSAAARIYSTIDRKDKIKKQNDLKIQLPNLKGDIKFENVTFCYPKYPQVKILQNFSANFNFAKNGVTGESGCGKSTIIQLILRFYDPILGRITVDGQDLRDLDLNWWRSCLGYVGQEPTLFATTIRENLLLVKPEASQQDMLKAIKLAQADFILRLPDKLDTHVGHKGLQLSGGQKQRIALARILIKDPQIFLLDEATSALDLKNEKLIQETLNKLGQTKRVITIAHRRSALTESDIIFVLEKGGKIKEQGKLKDLKSTYITQQQEKNSLNPEDQDSEMLTDEILQEEAGLTEKTQQSSLKKTEIYKGPVFTRIFKYGSKKTKMYAIGILASLINGSTFPVLSILLSMTLWELYAILKDPKTNEQIQSIRIYSYILIGISGLSFVLNVINSIVFAHYSEFLTKQMRVDFFSKTLKMPVSFLQKEGLLSHIKEILEVGTKKVSMLCERIVYLLVELFGDIFCALVIAFIFEWRTALVGIVALPLIMFSSFMMLKIHVIAVNQNNADYRDSLSLAMQSILQIKTVQSLNIKTNIQKKFESLLSKPFKQSVKRSVKLGLVFGISQFSNFASFGVVFYLGALFASSNEEVTILNMLIAVYAIAISAFFAGNFASFVPDIGEARNAAIEMFKILDSEDEDQKQIRENSKLLKKGFEKEIIFKGVSFKYQSRQNQILKKLDLSIKWKQKVAFVGSSGSGKSSVLKLLQRFYNPTQGQILINNINIKDFDIHYLRSQIGVVSQEPILFKGSFRDNIVYNLEGKLTDKQLLEAASQANALKFIVKDREQSEKAQIQSFNRQVGIQGSHLSGGQKQRIAIARAIIRNPTLLLLDEATSALDRKSEKIVQDQIDIIMKEKTTITIAHRLETIQNSDQIFVFQDGGVIESGNHQSLIQKKQKYYSLVRKSL